MTAPLPIARNDTHELSLLPALANRHGLITGATGTGKIVILQRLAEQLSKAGVPVFMADVKGDLSGLGAAGSDSPKLQARLSQLNVADWAPRANPVCFWDVFGSQGHPVRAAAETLRPNPAFDAASAITELGVGEALVSFLDEQGTPTVVERAWILPPAARIGPLCTTERDALIKDSLLYGRYETAVDRESRPMKNSRPPRQASLRRGHRPPHRAAV